MPRFDPAGLPARVLHRDAEMLILDKPAGRPSTRGRAAATISKRISASCDSARRRRRASPIARQGYLGLPRPRPLPRGAGPARPALPRRARGAKTYWRSSPGGRPGGGRRSHRRAAGRRSQDRRSWWMKVDRRAMPSLTRWRVLGRAGGIAWLELSPETAARTSSGCIAPIWAGRSRETLSTAGRRPARRRAPFSSTPAPWRCRAGPALRCRRPPGRRSTCARCWRPAAGQARRRGLNAARGRMISLAARRPGGVWSARRFYGRKSDDQHELPQDRMLLAAMTALFGVVGFALGGLGMIAALAFAAVLQRRGALAVRHDGAVGLWRAAGGRARRARAGRHGQRPRRRGGHAAAARVYIVHEPQPNAFATGRSPATSAVAVTTGLLERLTREEVAASSPMSSPISATGTRSP